jgi:LacI family transcriptional regulator
LTTGVTGIFCYNDMVAVGALLACQELNILIPQNLSLVGFDDIALCRYVTPSLTTVCQPKLEIGRSAMQMLLDLLEEKSVENLVLSPFVVKRNSTTAFEQQSAGAEGHSREFLTANSVLIMPDGQCPVPPTQCPMPNVQCPFSIT